MLTGASPRRLVAQQLGGDSCCASHRRCSSGDVAVAARISPRPTKNRPTAISRPCCRRQISAMPVIASNVIGPMVQGMSAPDSLAPEVEDVIQRLLGRAEPRCSGRIMSLFVDGASRFNDDHINLLDEVFCRLMDKVDTSRSAMHRAKIPG